MFVQNMLWYHTDNEDAKVERSNLIGAYGSRTRFVIGSDMFVELLIVLVQSHAVAP
jgi:hypothetical protein